MSKTRNVSTVRMIKATKIAERNRGRRIIRTVEAFRVFDIIYIITFGAPANGTVTISFQTYLETFSNHHLGSGAALSFLVSAFTLIMALLYMRFLYKPRGEN